MPRTKFWQVLNNYVGTDQLPDLFREYSGALFYFHCLLCLAFLNTGLGTGAASLGLAGQLAGRAAGWLGGWAEQPRPPAGQLAGCVAGP